MADRDEVIAQAVANPFSSIRIYLNSRKRFLTAELEEDRQSALEAMLSAVEYLTTPELDAVVG